MSFNDLPIRVVIPARYGSSRLPGKPLLDLAGSPLIVRAWRNAKLALPHLEIVVATDDARIASLVGQHGIPCAMTSPDHPSGTDRIAEVCDRFSWSEDDIVVNVQGDEPEIPGDLLRAFIGYCQKNLHGGVATVAVPFSDVVDIPNPNLVKVVVGSEDRALFFSRSVVPYARDVQSDEILPSSYLRHIGIYAYTVGILRKFVECGPCSIEQFEKLEQLRALWHGISVKVMRWHSAPPPGIDTPEDVERFIRMANYEK